MIKYFDRVEIGKNEATVQVEELEGMRTMVEFAVRAGDKAMPHKIGGVKEAQEIVVALTEALRRFEAYRKHVCGESNTPEVSEIVNRRNRI